MQENKMTHSEESNVEQSTRNEDWVKTNKNLEYRRQKFTQDRFQSSERSSSSENLCAFSTWNILFRDQLPTSGIFSGIVYR